MSLADELLAERERTEPVQDVDLTDWYQKTATADLTCDDPDCGATITAGERYLECSESEETWHHRCFHMHQECKRLIANDLS